MVHFSDVIYNKEGIRIDVRNAYLPGIENGKWDYYGYSNRKIDKNKFEEFKTRFYKLQGWDTNTGYPTRDTLESLGMSYVADELENKGKIGKG
jgi:aldehyde:ferredoxin oxidoreductase